jgi:hypothetical protein
MFGRSFKCGIISAKRALSKSIQIGGECAVTLKLQTNMARSPP